MPDALEKHLMLDLETLGTGCNSAIMEIGAVAFDPYGELLGEFSDSAPGMFYRAVDVDSCLKIGMEVDGPTIMWWFGQDEAARTRLINAPRVVIGTAAEALRKFCQDHTITHVWGHGATFDPVIMAEAYRRLRKDTPWDHRKVRDTRTLFGVTDLTEEKWTHLMRRPFKHHPVCDAWAQARAVQYCLSGDGDDTPTPQDPAGARALAG